ncbi:hypothetical protein ACFTWF_03220 [Rhodococcus sp. NPDC056960]|uniref:hypothetical protein n=1 Tax=Rhodococcus sp. NPDC056960 TaxID=3345982 RepID=UPI003635E3EF
MYVTLDALVTDAPTVRDVPDNRGIRLVLGMTGHVSISYAEAENLIIDIAAVLGREATLRLIGRLQGVARQSGSEGSE